MDLTQLEQLGAADAARAIAGGVISSEQLVQACLARIRAVEPAVQAWQYLDEAHALTQARARDLDRSEGRAIGPLHGVPIGIKDIIDTADMPTEDGSVLHAGRTPDRDAAVVATLRAAGAVILGKTVTTELATYAPGKTRNPHNAERSPGGSSSGSAAAVAAGMVPLALGTQTNGSVIRPAAYCGVIGFKPTHGLISRHGILTLSRTLDSVGMFARSIEDIALLAEQLVGYDERDLDTKPRARIPFSQVAASEPPLPPSIGFIKTPVWDRADDTTRQAFAELAEVLGAQCEEVELPEALREAWDWHRTIMEAEMAASLELEWEKGRDKLSDSLRQQLERGRAALALDYQKARARVALLNQGFEETFTRFDALLTPAAPGAAPAIASTGDPAFCTLWTLCGMPSLSLPLMTAPDGMPLGAQLVAARGMDARLLRTARWLQSRVVASA